MKKRSVFLMTAAVTAVSVATIVVCSNEPAGPKPDDNGGKEVIIVDGETGRLWGQDAVLAIGQSKMFYNLSGQIDGEPSERVYEVEEVEEWDGEEEGEEEEGERWQMPTLEELKEAFREKVRLANMPLLAARDNAGNFADEAYTQVVTFHDRVKTKGWKVATCHDGLDRETLVTTNYRIQSAYDVANDRDYYFITQEIQIPNGPLWSDTMGVTRCPDNRHYDYKGFWMWKLNTNSTLRGEENTRINGLSMSQASPETKNNVTNHTTTVTGGITGAAGFSGKGGASILVSGGVSWTTSTQWSIQDVGVTNHVSSDGGQNADWRWITAKVADVKYVYSFPFGKTIITDPAELARTTAFMYTAWIWIVPRPKEAKGPFIMRTRIDGTHTSTTHRHDSPGERTDYDTPWSVGDHVIHLVAPYRLIGYDFEMVEVPRTTTGFDMGCTPDQGDNCDAAEKPIQRVALSGFSIGKNLVTQRMWKDIMGDLPKDLSVQGDNLPITLVSWNSVQQFISKLNFMTGKRYRLPTEAEWEFAARGGDETGGGYMYAGSNDIASVGWYEGNSGGRLHAVGDRGPNALGIHDMSGNVREWVNDCWGPYESGSIKSDPTGPSCMTAGVGGRVIRNCSYSSPAEQCRISFRDFMGESTGSSIVGFRLVHPN
ncbi:MAG: formylglycine-generating enzyme family protein [Chitinispirillales bacterium]|nr:formylglycine-generating enzyme family protein [Chitinispirillales bacterium]